MFKQGILLGNTVVPFWQPILFIGCRTYHISPSQCREAPAVGSCCLQPSLDLAGEWALSGNDQKCIKLIASPSEFFVELESCWRWSCVWLTEFTSLIWKQWSVTRLSAGIYAFPNSHPHWAVIHLLGAISLSRQQKALPLLCLSTELFWSLSPELGCLVGQMQSGRDKWQMLQLCCWFKSEQTGDLKCPAAAGLRRNKGLKALWWVCFQEGRCYTVALQALPWTECAVLEGMELVALAMLKFHLPYFFSDGARKIYHSSPSSAREEMFHLMLILS